MIEKEKLQAIEVIPPLKTKSWETQGGPIRIFRLKLMSPQQIEAHGLQKYAPKRGDNNEQ